MTEIKRCLRCILPESLPSVKLDEKGVCRHCNNYQKDFSDWNEIKNDRKKEFEAQIKRVKGLHREYDCLIPLSGGKDSTFALYICSKIYGMKCLCVTFDNGFFSDYAQENIKNAIAATDADHIYYKINRKTLLGLYGLFLKKCGNLCPVCMRGIAVCTQMMMTKFRIPMIVTGDGHRITYSAFISELFEGGGLSFFREVLKGEPLSDQARPLLQNPYPWNMKKVARIASDLFKLPHAVPPFIMLWDYVDTPSKEMYQLLETEMGWKRRDEHDEHSDCHLDNVVVYIQRTKFPELTTTTLKNAARVRWGQLDRADAIRIEEEALQQPLEPPEELGPFLKEIKMSEAEFAEAIKDWRHLSKFRKKKSGLRGLYQKLTGIRSL